MRNHADQRVDQAGKSATKWRLLLVDDERTVREALQLVFEVEGFDVAAVSNCRDAMEQLDEWDVDLVLLDINIAHENGWDLCRQVLAQKPHLRIIVITARPDQASIALESEVDALMEKPLNLPGLLEIINGLLMKESAGKRSQRLGTLRPASFSSIDKRSLAEVNM